MNIIYLLFFQESTHWTKQIRTRQYNYYSYFRFVVVFAFFPGFASLALAISFAFSDTWTMHHPRPLAMISSLISMLDRRLRWALVRTTWDESEGGFDGGTWFSMSDDVRTVEIYFSGSNHYTSTGIVVRTTKINFHKNLCNCRGGVLQGQGQQLPVCQLRQYHHSSTRLGGERGWCSPHWDRWPLRLPKLRWKLREECFQLYWFIEWWKWEMILLIWRVVHIHVVEKRQEPRPIVRWKRWRYRILYSRPRHDQMVGMGGADERVWCWLWRGDNVWWLNGDSRLILPCSI